MAPPRPGPSRRIPGPGGRPEEFREETAQEAGLAGFGDRADRFIPVHGKVLDRGLDSAEAAMEDDRERHVVDDGVVGRSVARVHQTRIFAEGRVPGAVIPVLDDPMAAVESQQPLGIGLLGGQRGHAIGHLDGFVAGLDPMSLAGNAENLSDGRVVDQAGKGCQDLNLTPFDAAMSLLVVFGEVGSGVPVPVDWS